MKYSLTFEGLFQRHMLNESMVFHYGKSNLCTSHSLSMKFKHRTQKSATFLGITLRFLVPFTVFWVFDKQSAPMFLIPYYNWSLVIIQNDIRPHPVHTKFINDNEYISLIPILFVDIQFSVQRMSVCGGWGGEWVMGGVGG